MTNINNKNSEEDALDQLSTDEANNIVGQRGIYGSTHKVSQYQPGDKKKEH